MRLPIVVNAFEDDLKAGAPQNVCVGARELVQAVVTQDELSKLFGGYIIYIHRVTSAEFLGVWGARKASAFRGLLRNRGFTVDIQRQRPGNVRVKMWSTR